MEKGTRKILTLRYFSPSVVQRIHFRGDGDLPKITKIRLPKVLNFSAFFQEIISLPGKTRNHLKLRIFEKGIVELKQEIRIFFGALY